MNLSLALFLSRRGVARLSTVEVPEQNLTDAGDSRCSERETHLLRSKG